MRLLFLIKEIFLHQNIKGAISLFVILIAPINSSAQETGSFQIATSPAGTEAYVVAVGVSSLVKVDLTPRTKIDLDAFPTSGFLESLALLDNGQADFALLSAAWDDLITTDLEAEASGAFDHGIQAVATLRHEGERSIQLVARRDVDPAVVYEIVKTIFENLQFLKTIDVALADTSLDMAMSGMTLPVHAGAWRYFEENQAVPIEMVNKKPAAPASDENPRSAPIRESKGFVVYFDFDDATIDAEGLAELDKLEALAEELETSTIWIGGYTDSAGDAAYNLALGQRRIDAVMEELRSRGVHARDVYAADFGERLPWVETGDEKIESRNRRVEILVEPHDASVVVENPGESIVGLHDEDARHTRGLRPTF